MRYLNHFPLILLILLLAASNNSTIAQKKKLTYDQIFKMRGPRLTKSLPDIKKWIDDNNYLEQKRDKNGNILYKIDAETSREEVYIDYTQWNSQLPEGLSINEAVDETSDLQNYLMKKDSSFFMFSIKEGVFKQLLGISTSIDNPSFSNSARYFAYTRNNDLYFYNTETEVERRITSDAADNIYNGYSSWVYYEEIFGRASKYKAFWWSPNEKYLAFMRFDDAPVPEFQIYNSNGTHGSWEKTHYPKSGDPLPTVKFGVYNVETGNIIWADFDEKADEMIAWPVWLNSGEQVVIQCINRAMDNIKLYKVDAATGNKHMIYEETQKTWVEFFEDLYLLKNDNGFLVRSDKDGFRHLYHYDLNGNFINRLTEGNYSVKDISQVDEKNGVVFFHSDKDESTNKYLYKVNLDGTGMTRLTDESGYHSCDVSTNGSYFIDKFSDIDTPTKMMLKNSDGQIIRELGDSKSELLDEYELGKVELFRIKTHDGYDLPVRWVLPPDFDKNKKYPVIFSVYGGPSSQTVFNSWSRFLSPYYYAQEGIIYVVADNRGSGHFGKKGEAELHRKLGEVEIDDFIEIAKWFRKQSFVDTNKIAITGGSYGGYATLMALTRGADVFNYGVAEYSVTDWLLYDNVYTERYMDKPEENPNGYSFGSVMTHADKYKGMVLITHGTTDDNVHLQNSLQLISKLQDLDKDFEMMFYPEQRHGVGFPKFFHASREKLQFWFRYLLGKELIID